MDPGWLGGIAAVLAVLFGELRAQRASSQAIEQARTESERHELELHKLRLEIEAMQDQRASHAERAVQAIAQVRAAPNNPDAIEHLIEVFDAMAADEIDEPTAHEIESRAGSLAAVFTPKPRSGHKD